MSLIERLYEVEDLASAINLLKQNSGYDLRGIVLELIEAGSKKPKPIKVKREELIPLLILESLDGYDERLKDRFYSVWQEYDKEHRELMGKENHAWEALENKEIGHDTKHRICREAFKVFDRNMVSLKKRVLESFGKEGMATLTKMKEDYFEQLKQLRHSFDKHQESTFRHYTTKSGFPVGYLLFTKLWS